MNGLMDFLIGYFSVFFEVMFFIPTRFKVWYWHEAALLGLILAVALGVIFLCNWLMKKYNLGFTASVLLTFLILSIPRLDLNPSIPFLIVGLGSPVLNIALSLVAALGNRWSQNYPKAGTLFLFGVGILFANVLLTTFAVFFLSLYNY